ncbi:MAG: RidA family protein, partial [Pseudomonadota bacterium]
MADRALRYPIGKKNPNLPFHPAVRAGDFIFVSGQVAKDENGNLGDKGVQFVLDPETHEIVARNEGFSIDIANSDVMGAL